MTTDTRSLSFDSSSDALFRVWGSGVSASLVACGLVLHTDTGQINWASVTRVNTSSTENVTGYEIFRFADALQATKPVFIKVEYGHANGSATAGPPVMWVTVGTATDGAGTLTGSIISTRTRLIGNTGSLANVGGAISGSASPIFTCGDTSSIFLALGVTNTAQPRYNGSYQASFPAFLCVERTRDSAGVATNKGVYVLTSGWIGVANAPASVPTSTCQMLSFTGSNVGTQEAYWPVAWPGQAFASSGSGTDFTVWPMPVATPDACQALAVLGSYKGELALGVTLSLTVLGSSHTYRSLGNIAGTVSADAARGHVNTFVASGSILMRYE